MRYHTDRSIVPVHTHGMEKNRLVELLPRRDRKRLLALCVPVELEFKQILWHQGQSVRHVYFPLASFISLVATLDGEPVLEVGMAGNEGVLGAQLTWGAMHAPLHAVVQGPGTALRLAAADFRLELAGSKALRGVLDRYLSVLMGQLSTSAACVRFHLIGPRLARWLLMTQDRAGASTFYTTHEFLSYMLGVRRVGITAAAGVLQAAGVISYTRGEVRVLDRGGLERSACSCYATDKQCYAAAGLMGHGTLARVGSF